MEHPIRDDILITLNHEIRTPLARLRFQLEAAEARDFDRRAVHAMEAEIEAVVLFLDQLRSSWPTVAS